MNIELEKVVETYERNQKRGDKIACYGVLKLLNSFFDEENDPHAERNMLLRDRLYSVLSGDLFIGQQYSFPDRKPREDLYLILQREVDLSAERLEKIKKALRNLPTAERDVATAKKIFQCTIDKLNNKIVSKEGAK